MKKVVCKCCHDKGALHHETWSHGTIKQANKTSKRVRDLASHDTSQTSHITPDTWVLTLHTKDPPRTDETEGPASKLARVPTEPSRNSPNRNVGEKAEKYSNRKKERLEQEGRGAFPIQKGKSAVGGYDGQHRPQKHCGHWNTEKHTGTPK